MDREGFRNRLKQYKKAREENPGLKYWEFIKNNTDQYGNAVSTEESPIYDEAYLKLQKQILDNLRVVDQIERKRKEFDLARIKTDKKGTKDVTGPPTEEELNLQRYKKLLTVFDDIALENSINLSKQFLKQATNDLKKEISGRAKYERAAHHMSAGDWGNLASYLWDSNEENIPYYTGSVVRGFDKSIDYVGDPVIYQGNATVANYAISSKQNIDRDLVKNFIYGEDLSFKKSNKNPLTINGKTYSERQYEGQIAPIDTIYFPKSMLSTVDSLIAEKSIYGMDHNMGYTPSFYRQDRMGSYTQDNVAKHSGVFRKDKENQYSAELFDLWDFMGNYDYGWEWLAHKFQKDLQPDTLFPNAGPFIIRQDIPIKFIEDSVLNDTRSSGKYFLQNLDTTSNKTSIRLKQLLEKWNKSYAEGGEVGEDDFMKQFGKQVSYKPEEARLRNQGYKNIITDGRNWRKRPTQEQLDAFYKGDVQRLIQLAEQAGLTVTYTNPKYELDEVVVTAKDLKKEQQRKQEYNNVLDLGITVAGFAPGLGEVADAVDVVNQLRLGNYSDAALAGLGFVLPFVPGSALRRLKNKAWEFIGDKTGYYKHIPEKENEAYRQVRLEAIEDAEKLGIVRSNPNSHLHGKQIHWAGASFQKGKLYNPRDKYSNTVIVGNINDTEFVSRPGHMKYDEFDITDARKGNGEYYGDEVTPIFNNSIDAAPINKFYYYQKGNKGLSKYFWKKKKFKLDNVELNNMPDDVLDELYLHSINTYDAINTQRLRDLHFIKNAPNTIAQVNGLPQVWYHGAPYGNYNKFNSSKFNATIGGTSAIGDKGNFFTTDLPSAQRYAGRADAPMVDSKKLFDFGDKKGVLNVIDKVDNVVYPMYLNAKNPLIVAFKGQPWRKSPVEVPNSYTITEHFFDDAGNKYIDNTLEYLSEDDALSAFAKYDLPYEDRSVLKNKPFVDRTREIYKWTSAPRYETVHLTETYIPNTTNGIVNWASRKGNDSAWMTNVIDSNGGGIDNKGYAIDDLVVFKSSLAKLKDAITYDDDGNIIKLSKRDDFSNDDIRFAEGGQVEPDPLEVLERSKPRVAGIPINDKPLSGTDPIGEAVMWGLGGGAASAVLRKLFPTYGPMAAWLAFGEKGKENMLVVPKDPTSLNVPVKKNIVSKDVLQYFADDVLPRDIVTSKLDKEKFLNNEKNFQYNLYPQYHFNENAAGYYDKHKDIIAINNKYVGDKDLVDNIITHEVNHRYDAQYPLDKEHSKILNRAYTVLKDAVGKAAPAARKQTEKRATNANIRHKLYTELRNTLGKKPTKEDIDKYIDSIPDSELLDKLSTISAYGSIYRMSIEDRLELLSNPIHEYRKRRATLIRKALKRIAMNETENDNNQNYA